MQHIAGTMKYFGLPLLAAVYPAVFHFANNAHLVLLSSMLQLTGFLAVVGLTVYMVFVLLTRGRYPQSGVATTVMLAFFHTYGLAFDGLRSLDILQVETYNFLPFYIFMAAYMGWRVACMERRRITHIWNLAVIFLGVLVVFNVVKLIPAELDKSRNAATVNSPTAMDGPGSGKLYPDIYYLIFDEAAGFEAVRQYWNYGGVDEFVAFLKSNGFYVAEKSHGHSTGTLYELATRLNYRRFPLFGGDEYYDMYDEAIGHNLVMDYLKTHGYTLIAYDERRLYLSTLSPLPVDHLVEESPGPFVGDAIHMDDYKTLVLENTMLRSYVSQKGQESIVTRHRNMILHTVKEVGSIQLSSPKFVYVHLFLPHVPFAFTANGDIQTGGGLANWQKYLDNYRFFLRIAQRMVENILAGADPDKSPVIIIQSDHGARNIEDHPYTGYLEDYPDEYKTLIVNALYMPGCHNASLTQDMDPINTFPIVFNCYFDANIPLR